MQSMPSFNAATMNRAAHVRIWSVALCLTLAACQAPSGAPLPAAEQPVVAAPITGPTAPEAQAAQDVTDPSAGTAGAAGSGQPSESSFTDAPLQPQYTRCVQDSRGMTDKLQACGDIEFAHHKALLTKEVTRLMGGPDGPAKDRWMDEQALWAEQTDARCRWDPETDGQGQMLDAQSCLINRYANRAVELQGRTLLP